MDSIECKLDPIESSLDSREIKLDFCKKTRSQDWTENSGPGSGFLINCAKKSFLHMSSKSDDSCVFLALFDKSAYVSRFGPEGAWNTVFSPTAVPPLGVLISLP